MSLCTSHPLWTFADSPYEVEKATTVASMLSGRYVTDYRSRHWAATNPDGLCQICKFLGFPSESGTLTHLLLNCPGLSEVRSKMIKLWSNYMINKPTLLPVVKLYTITSVDFSDQDRVQFLLDPSVCPEVISSVQINGSGILSDLLYLTRTWCHSHHVKRRNLLKLYNVIWCLPSTSSGRKWYGRSAAPDKKGVELPSMDLDFAHYRAIHYWS